MAILLELEEVVCIARTVFTYLNIIWSALGGGPCRGRLGENMGRERDKAFGAAIGGNPVKG